MKPNERINKILEYTGLNAKSFSEKIGLERPQAIYDIQNSKTKSVSKQMLDKIISVFPQINRMWLLTGEGEMLISDSEKEGPNKNYDHGVPYYDVDFIGGFDLVLNDQTTTPKYLIDFKPYNEATCWCNVTGRSMEPEIAHGDIIALKKIEDTRFIPLGEIYAIVTSNDMRTIKRIGPASDPSMYKLIPENKSPEYGEQEIPKDMVIAIYQVLGSMKKF